MKLARKYPILGSSQNPDNVSLMLKGLVALIASIAIHQGVELDQVALLNTLVGVITAISTLISGVTFLWGLARKFIKK